MLLKFSLAALLLVKASSPDDEKKPSSEMMYRSMRLPAIPPVSKEILIPSSRNNLNVLESGEEPIFLPPPGVNRRRRNHQRMQNLESGSSSYRNSAGLDSFFNNSPHNEVIGVQSSSMLPYFYSFVGNSKTNSFVDGVPFYNDSYSYQKIAISHGQMSSGDIIPVEEPKAITVAPQKTKSKKRNSSVKVEKVKPEKAEKDDLTCASDRKKPDDSLIRLDRRKVTADLFKNPDLNDSASPSSRTPNGSYGRKGNFREAKGEKKDAYLSALSEALMLKPNHPANPHASSPPSIESPPPPALPEGTVPFDQWSMLFRLPSSMVGDNKWGYFKFSRCLETDAIFAKQLDDFRASIKGTQELPCAMDYVPFPVDGIPLELQPPNRPVSVKPVKIFDAQPAVIWNYVECSVLGMEFELIRERKGRELNSGRKYSIQYVKSGNRKFVRKVYNSVEYFLNELKFLQHAHHGYLPNPICIEKRFPSIVMERVQGPRFHDAMFLTMTNNYSEIKESLKDHENPKIANDLALQRAWTKTWDVMVLLVAKLMTVIQYIHSLGFVHCDIKPENVIYEEGTGRIVLIDFDLSSTAPYLYSSRGTVSTIAPEVVGLLKGPVHFAADWWGFGSTVAIIAAFAYAGYFDCLEDYETAKSLTKYTPFVFNHTEMTYTMTPLPHVFPPVMREFLYPFFSPVPAHRHFSEPSAFEWISSHPFFSPVKNMKKYSVVTVLPSMVAGLIKFSQNPAVLVKMPHGRKVDYTQNMETLNRIIHHYKRQEEEGEDEGNGDDDDEDNHESGVFAIDEDAREEMLHSDGSN